MFLSLSLHAIGVLTVPDQNGTQQDAHVETISLLPLEYTRRRRNLLWECIGRIQGELVDQVTNAGCTCGPVLQFRDGRKGGPDGGTHKLLHLTLVLGGEQQVPDVTFEPVLEHLTECVQVVLHLSVLLCLLSLLQVLLHFETVPVVTYSF